MLTHWQQLLSQTGNPLTLDGARDDFIAPLPELGLLLTHGADAAKFIQGQSSCDIRDVKPEHAQYGSFSTPKGRCFANFMASQQSDDHYLLRVHHSALSNTQQTLAKYLAFFKAEQIDTSDQYYIFGLKGPIAKNALSQVFDSIPCSDLASTQQNGHTLVCINSEQQLYECWLHKDSYTDALAALTQYLNFVESSYWQLELIQLGLADITDATIDEFIPQMLNYQHTGAISFTKGCFTGQEIIARMQYKGKVKRRLYRVTIDCSATIKAGTELFIKDKKQASGTVVNICTNSNKQLEALAVLTVEASEEHQLFLKDGSAIQLNLLELPYPVESN